MGRKPTVGGKAEHSKFARDLSAYLTHVRDSSGLSVRGVSALTFGSRSNSWWADIFNGSKILTTNDVQFVADLLGISPYEFVGNARRLAQGQPVPLVTFDVSGSDEDGRVLTPDEERRYREGAIAALRGRNEADLPHAE